MRLKISTLLTAILLASSPNLFSSWANDLAQQQSAGLAQGPGEELKLIKKYLLNLGKSFGYDVEQFCGADGNCDEKTARPDDQLINKDAVSAFQIGLYSNFLGTLMIGEANPILPKALIQNLGSDIKKPFVNYEKPDSDPISVSALVDQKAFQADPVNQAILNLLSTPDISFCQQNTVTDQGDPCQAISRQAVITIPWADTKGTANPTPGSQNPVPINFPTPAQVFLSTQNQPILPQLNSNTLIMPLLYSGKTEGGAPPNNNQQGLVANTQAQQAANFVRYVTGLVSPITMLNFDDYIKQYTAASGTETGVDPAVALKNKTKAQTILADYLVRLRMYAAQSSVAIGNIYFILSRRLPLDDKGETSTALSEFQMASWRIYNSKEKDPELAKAWLTKIQKSSAASVQKEIAVLLAEINYQMYLTRQQNERMLLTQSVALLQMARFFAAPNPRLDQPQMMP